jgi:serine/threonine protein kinase
MNGLKTADSSHPDPRMENQERLTRALADRYSVEGEIGSGGMATVYLAQDLKHERNVAVKVFRPELSAAIGSERFLREIKITAGLNHPHILPLLDSGKADSFLFYVMPYVDGESLRDKLNRERELEIEDSLRITGQIASALAYAHSKDIVHRDIKPENILLQAGQVVVADFGIALAVDSAGGVRLTETGLSIGTPAYMSPEQVAGEKEIDSRSDIYSLACVLYEMLAGDPPFTASNPRAVLAKHLTDPAPPVTTARPGVATPVAAAIAKALGKVPADRFESALAFTHALSSASLPQEETGPKAIVVLPFANLSPDPENEYFSDGLTEEIITDLSKVRALRVISRNSAMQLKGTEKNTRQICRELRVQYVLQGSVRKAGNRLRIAAQLIEGESDGPVWAEKYDGVTDDIFAIQESVSKAIVEELNITLTSDEWESYVERPIDDVRAHECVLRARREIWQFTPESTAQAIRFLLEALQIVGENALLYEGLAQAYFTRAHAGVEDPDAELQKMAECIDKTLALNPNSSFCHTCAGLLDWKKPGRQLEGVRRMKYAFDINPNDINAAVWFNFCASEAGRLDLADPAAARLLEIDPLSVEAQWGMGWRHFMGGEFPEALEYYQRAYHLDSNSAVVRHFNVHGLMLNKRFDEACAMAETMERDLPEAGYTWLSTFFKHVLRDEKSKALETVSEQVEETGRFDETYSYWLSEGYALLDEKAQALDWLENAVNRGFLNYPYLSKHAPFFGNIRGEPRFLDVMARVESEWEQFEV